MDVPLAFYDRDASLQGEEYFNGVVFDVSMVVRFSYPQLTIFTWESENQQRWFVLYVISKFFPFYFN